MWRFPLQVKSKFTFSLQYRIWVQSTWTTQTCVSKAAAAAKKKKKQWASSVFWKTRYYPVVAPAVKTRQDSFVKCLSANKYHDHEQKWKPQYTDFIQHTPMTHCDFWCHTLETAQSGCKYSYNTASTYSLSSGDLGTVLDKTAVICSAKSSR